MKKVPSQPGLYADADGRIWSDKSGRLVCLKLRLEGGYLRVDYGNVHRLVCEAFHGPADGRETNHKDGVKINNQPTNLEWASRQENMTHAHATGLIDLKKRGAAIKAAWARPETKENHRKGRLTEKSLNKGAVISAALAKTDLSARTRKGWETRRKVPN